MRRLKTTTAQLPLLARAPVPAKLKSSVVLAFCLFPTLLLSAKDPSLVTLANPLMGTDSSVQFSHGNEYPSIALPFPMNAWAPYTQPQRDSFFYQFRRKQIRGLRQTHQPSPWMGDYGNFALMPVSGQLVVNEQDRASEFQHQNEIAEPAYYSVQLDTWNARAEVTPTERAARFRFTFNDPGDSYVAIDVFEDRVRLGEVKFIPSENKLIGIARDNRGGVPPNFANYFVIVFDRPFSSFGVWSPDSVQSGVTHLEHKHAGAFAKFDTSKEHGVECKVASSYISFEQAELNLRREIGSADFDAVRHQAEVSWNQHLGRALVVGGTEEQRRTFYSCLYRALLFPEKFYELDSAGKPVHYSPYDGKIHDGVLFTDSGFWDTFRAAHPLYTLLFPEVSEQIQQSLLHAYDESGWLPEWPSPGHRSIMIGQNSFSLLADAWVKGVTNFDATKAVVAMVHDANAEGPMPAVGRNGVQYYNKLGYVPYSSAKGEPAVEEATAKTLEYAYDDFCAAKLARAIGKDVEAETFARHAFNYTNLFDPGVTFMRERKADGSWNEPFFPDQWGGGFTEGCSWHWTWCVFQDIPGLVRLMGGDKAFADKLNAVFNTEPTVRVGTYGGVIHEMTEMVAANMGQYAHGNEPIHHMLYLYDYVGQPWKTQSRVRQVLNLLYQPTPAGYCGDEDTGQMSAWYVFGALGFYPVCPGTPDYIIGSPLFDRATLSFPGSKTFTITAEDNSTQKPYIRRAELNDVSFDRTFIEHDELVRGGELVFHMTSAPDYHWATGPESRPPSAIQELTRSRSDQASHP